MNKNTGKYRTTNEIQESTGQLQKIQEFTGFTGPLGSLHDVKRLLSLHLKTARRVDVTH